MTDIVLCAVGACTSVGLTAVETGFLYRAGATGLREGPLLDLDENPITMGVLPVLSPETLGVTRLHALLRLALGDVRGELGALQNARCLVSVLVEEELATRGSDGVVPAQALSEILRQETRGLFGDNAAIEVWPLGAGGGAQTLAGAVKCLMDGSADVVLFGGIHSDCFAERITRLATEARIFHSDNRDALLLGEAAAFVVLCRADVARRLGLPVRARLVGFAGGFEEARPDNDHSAFEAKGLTTAVQAVAQNLGGQRVGWLLSDLNLEMFRQYEFQAVLSRTQKYFCEPQVLDAPAQRLGHLGAAALPVHLAFATEAWRRGYAPFPLLLSTTGSDSGARTAVLAAAPPSR